MQFFPPDHAKLREIFDQIEQMSRCRVRSKSKSRPSITTCNASILIYHYFCIFIENQGCVMRFTHFALN